ncbi:MAG: ankyrin repeat domain-containing protein [Gemmatimonadota bacterium]|nr:ankyrin repeat domain-containing protein [Gemmatimonadota bacterium]
MTQIETSFRTGRVAGGVRGTLAWLCRVGRVGRCVVLMLPFALAAQAGDSQEGDCFKGFDDIRVVRECIGEYGLQAWSPGILHFVASYTTNPTIVRLLLQAGADPDAPDNDGWTPLHQAGLNSMPVVVAHLLDAGADVNARDNEGYTPLHRAAGGNGRAAHVLLDRGADPVAGYDGRTPLHFELRYQAEPRLVSRLLDAGADEFLTPLQLSAVRGDLTGVEQLLAGGADPNDGDPYGWGPLHFAVPLGGPEVVSALLAAGADPGERTTGGEAALHLAARLSTSPVVSALLSGGADPNVRSERGWFPLHYAARYQEEALLPVITALLEAGADPESRDDYGRTPLHLAPGNPEMSAPAVEALLRAGADPMARDEDGETPLHNAAWQMSAPVVEALLRAGADPMARDKDGHTPLHDAAYADDHTERVTPVVEALVRAGADPMAQDEDGHTPLHNAAMAAELAAMAADRAIDVALIEALLAVGADPRAENEWGFRTSSDPVWDDDGPHYDVWTVTVETVGQRVVIDMESGDVDAYLRVLRKDGRTIATDDDGGSGSNATVTFWAPYAGDYFVNYADYRSIHFQEN